jgi:hypothetical protein
MPVWDVITVMIPRQQHQATSTWRFQVLGAVSIGLTPTAPSYIVLMCICKTLQ